MTTTVTFQWRSFHAKDWFYVAGRGWVAVVECPVDWNKADGYPDGIGLGEEVLINGKPFIIHGIESYAMPCISRGTPIGLLVKPAESAKLPA